MQQLIMALMVWLAPVTGLPLPDHTPKVRMVDQCRIQELATDKKDCKQDGFRALAVYDHQVDTIYLDKGWNGADLKDVSILLHETVHFMQDQAGINYGTAPCPPRDVEGPAYAAQMKFLHAAGVDPFEVMDTNPVSVFILTTCLGRPTPDF